MARFKRNSKEEDKARKAKLNATNIKKALRLFQYVKPQKRYFLIGLLFLMLSSLASMIFPYLSGALIDAAKSEGLNQINNIALLLLLVFFLNAIFSYFRIVLFAIVTQKTLASLRQVTYSHLLHLKMTFFSERRIGELNSRISADISLLQETLTTTLAELIRQVIIISSGIALLSYISLKLTGLMLAIVPLVVFTAVIFGKKIKGFAKATQEEVANSNVIVEETLQAISSVKTFVNEAFEELRYKTKTEDIVGIAIKGAKWRGAFAAFLLFCLFGSIVVVIWYGVVLVQANELSIGSLFTFILYSVFVGASLGGLADLYAQVQKAIGATENLLDILDEEKEENYQTDNSEEIEKGKIVFQNVAFHYPNRSENQVLKDVSFHVNAGDQIAIVGPSGSGKTTLTALLLHFYQANTGNILIDDKDIESYSLNNLRGAMAIVPQEVLLFGGTIYENILYGKPSATKEEVHDAAEKANALEFIQNFKEGFETTVGERGIQLSGGQRQRIAIARAILKNPKILILDEATSSLDSKSEQAVQSALEKLMKGRTSIVIAHRLSTIQKADQIIVLKNGEIIESGTHNSLNEKKGLYYELSELQS